MSDEIKPQTITIEYSKSTAEPNAKCNEECNDECKAVKSNIFNFTNKNERKELEEMIRDFVGEVLGRRLDGNDSLKITEKGQNRQVTIDWLLFPDATNRTYCVHVTRSSNIPFYISSFLEFLIFDLCLDPRIIF